MLLEVSAVSAFYDGIQALRDVSLSVDHGEMVALIGSNGAGKSTLLNVLSGMVQAPAGSIGFKGRDIRGEPPHRIARLGLLHVPEGRQILSDLTVLENLQLGELARGERKEAFSVASVLNLFPILEERRGQLAGTLSGGQQQMLAIGRALMGAPELLMLDEPSLGLSPLITDQVFAALTVLNQRGLPILLVEQNAHRALSSTARAYVLERGQIAYSGRSEDLARDESVLAHYLGEEPSPA
ncbi:MULTISPECIES: ABC transporter ATP-binding protein [unclassified Chelatococcus]|uniref:ABC transporter ATP-binding protein n=1 Tax=unclassified Chelatococcus TaxID=2638111 RepID=UPI001BCD4014|nr:MULTISPECIES: ABC transporter ATP-binding protein [unclassified Chelatococcus]CAH1653060.1 branched chain amino acid/phenylalanine ABC transporter ATP binding subunit LivF [Hyphomicrobiales bacterium]MBS7742952.1 ABC transporter ATP-binding protein [Chelatococcus sp. HY11]MBX3541930.1 ABC transporter ATP-binding protein [Chelatococcus sp.]MCO5074179.1 ABC transporter ATP-binding protein [Chelatococcus sp.]CAH1694205.1 High-affinity branched-chain amino acid transport ATP-binding protein Bra